MRQYTQLVEADYTAAAQTIGCEVATIKAASEVESLGRGFLPDGRATILYEAHIFNRLTQGRFLGVVDRYGVSLASGAWDRSLYGASGARQYDRLADAMRFDEAAALGSCSWGMFQVMGYHFGALGFSDVDTLQEFVESTDEAREHLDLFVRYIMVNGLDDELQRKDWVGFARGYNGPGYAANAYHTKMAMAYAKHAGQVPSRVLSLNSTGGMVSQVQRALGLEPDAHFGRMTEAAVRGFQIGRGLEADGKAGPVTLAALGLQ